MSNGSWENIYVDQGRVQIGVLDSVVEARNIFFKNNYKDILDLGCGTGRHTYYLAHEGFNVHACDISETGLSMTKDLVAESGLNNVKYSIQDMYNLNFNDNSFDGILCIWTQGHGLREDIKKGVKELHRTLRKGGTVITDFCTIDDPLYGKGIEVAPRSYLGGVPGEEEIIHYFTYKDELKEFFRDFKEVNLKDKEYRFKIEDGSEYLIVVIVVEAVK